VGPADRIPDATVRPADTRGNPRARSSYIEEMRAALPVLILGILLAGSARAETFAELTTARGGVPEERKHEVAITLDGPVAEVTTRQVLTLAGKSAEVLVYRFPLPERATITDLTVTLPAGRPARGVVVDTRTALLEGAPDLAVLRPVARGQGTMIYELRVYPMPTRGELKVAMRWVIPAELDGGRLVVRIPGRGGARAFAPSDVTFTAVAPPGAAGFRELTGDGKVLARDVGGRGTVRFRPASRGDILVSAVPRLAGRLPVVLMGSAALDGEHTALGLAILTPQPSAAQMPEYERVVVVCDVSASMGEAGRRAARTLIAEVLRSLPADVRTEAILFSRTARRVVGKLAPNSAGQRQAIDEAIAAAPLEGGSEPGAALAMVRKILVDERTGDEEAIYRRHGTVPPTLVVVVSDGVAPLDFTGERAIDRYGRDLLDHAFIVAVTTFPDGADAPGVADSPMGALALRAGGRSILVRESEAPAQARVLAAELAQPAPLRGLRLDTGTTVVMGLELPGELPAGQGLVTYGVALGPAPPRATLSLFVGADEARVPVRRATGLAQRAVLPLWLAARSPDDFVPLADHIDGGEERDYPQEVWARARARYLAVAQRAHAITPDSALVAFVPGDELGADRTSFVQRWGPSEFGAMPPPAGAGPPAETVGDLRQDDRRQAGLVTVAREVRVLGELDENIVRTLLVRNLAPRARACYQAALRKDPRAEGRLDLVLEMSRGEVTSVQAASSSFRTPDMEVCVIEAAYALQVPRVAAEYDDGTIVVARYPLVFKVAPSGDIELRDDVPAPTPPQIEIKGPRQAPVPRP
jgi:hypothetical protein